MNQDHGDSRGEEKRGRISRVAIDKTMPDFGEER